MVRQVGCVEQGAWMRWIAIFTNIKDSDVLREKHLQAHLEYFDRMAGTITLAGSTTPPGQSFSNGGVWIIKGVSYEEARRICEEDPFYLAGLREKIEIFAFTVAPRFDELV